MMDMNEYVNYMAHYMHVSFPNNYTVLRINFKTINELKFSPPLTEIHRLKVIFFPETTQKKSLETEILQENSFIWVQPKIV